MPISPSTCTGTTTLATRSNWRRRWSTLRPMWIEDPVPPENPETMAYVRRESPVPVCTGENLYGFAGFQRLIELQGCDGVHIDIPKSGGLLESKRISDFAASYDIWTAAHNPASPVGTIASAHAASAMRNFRIHELGELDRLVAGPGGS